MYKLVLLFSLVCLLSCKENLINDSFSVYGTYESCDDSQKITLINFADGLIEIRGGELEDKYLNYYIIDSEVFTEDNQLFLRVLEHEKNKSMKLLVYPTNELNFFCD